MTSPWHSLFAAFLLFAPLVTADDWAGWPVESNTTYYAIADNHYIKQLYSGLVERCLAVGGATPTNVDTWACFAGTNAAGVISYTNIVTTNVYESFGYTYTNPITGDALSATGHPYIKQAWIAKWDQYFYSCAGGGTWVDRAQFDSNGLLVAWFTNHTNSVQFPVLALTNIFLNATAGHGTNFTRRPLLPTNDLVMCSIQYRTSSWWFAKIDTSDSYRYDTTPYPFIEVCPPYYAWPTQTFTITGQVWDINSQTASNTSETITYGITTNGYQLGKLWHNITNITVTDAGYGPPSNTTTWRIVYREGFATYGSMPYRLYALDLNERRNVLAELTHTAKSYDIWVNSDNSPPSTNWYWSRSANGYAFVDNPEAAVTSAVANFTYRNPTITSDTRGDNAGSACSRDWQNGNHTSHVYSVRLWGCEWAQWRVPQWVTNQDKTADLYALAKCIGSDGAQGDSAPPYALFANFGFSNIVYDTASYIGRTNVFADTGLYANTYGVVLTNAWSLSITDPTIITNYLATTTGVETTSYTKGLTFTKTCVVYCHTNWYRFK